MLIFGVKLSQYFMYFLMQKKEKREILVAFPTKYGSYFKSVEFVYYVAFLTNMFTGQ
jgi:hypothetical protein